MDTSHDLKLPGSACISGSLSSLIEGEESHLQGYRTRYLKEKEDSYSSPLRRLDSQNIRRLLVKLNDACSKDDEKNQLDPQLLKEIVVDMNTMVSQEIRSLGCFEGSESDRPVRFTRHETKQLDATKAPESDRPVRFTRHETKQLDATKAPDSNSGWQSYKGWIIATLSVVAGLATGLGVGFGATQFTLFGSASATAFYLGATSVSCAGASAFLLGLIVAVGFALTLFVVDWGVAKYSSSQQTTTIDFSSLPPGTRASQTSTGSRQRSQSMASHNLGDNPWHSCMRDQRRFRSRSPSGKALARYQPMSIQARDETTTKNKKPTSTLRNPKGSESEPRDTPKNQESIDYSCPF